MSLLTVEHLSKRFAGGPPVVSGLGFEIEEGEIFALLGPSGCGKTTTLRIVAGFERADEGCVTFGGQTLCAPGRHMAAEERGIGVVFQDYALFPHLTVIQNVMFGLREGSRAERKERAEKVLRMVGLNGYERRHPRELSGGQQQRVAIARTLAPQPRLVLLDEPFSNLDALLRQGTRQEIRSVLKRAGMTALLVTHDQEEALSFADRVAVMRGGRIEQVGTPEEVYYQPRTLFVAQFLGRTNLLLSTAEGRAASTPLGRLELNREARGNVLLSLRPEHLALAKPESVPGALEGRVLAREFKGHDITFRVDVGGAEYLAHTHNRVAFQPGDVVAVHATEPAVVLEGTPTGP
jgi:iron(III) transport system ATP-binding protein